MRKLLDGVAYFEKAVSDVCEVFMKFATGPGAVLGNFSR